MDVENRNSDIYDEYPFYERTDLVEVVNNNPRAARILILGCHGMLGRYIYKLCVSNGIYAEVVGITRNDFDFNQPSEAVMDYLTNLIRLNDLVVNCMGMINKRQSSSDADQLQFYRINSTLPRLLAQTCYDKGGFLVHITTDCVYDGKQGWKCRTDPHNSIDIYGMTKSLGDMSVRGHPMVSLLRTSIIGEDANNRSLVEWVIDEKNRLGSITIPGYTNHKWNGITCLKLAELILCIRLPIKDLNYRYLSQVNPMIDDIFFGKETIITSNKATSKYNLINLIARTYGVPFLVVPVEAPVEKNMQLSGTLKCEEDIETQIEKMYEFDVLNRRS